MNSKTEKFLKRHMLRSSDFDTGAVVGLFTDEMFAGLEGRGGSLHMIPTYFEAENDFLTDMPVLAIDAGGTNFRAAIVSFSGSGKIQTGEIVSRRMPGLDREVSSKEFFETMADYIRPLALKVDRIGFCFSYATEIQPDLDGRLLHFCKEVQAPEVVGKLIGKTLLETLGTPEKRIVLLNDTVATLLAGKSASIGKSYDSYIGFILGTGSNTAYIEKNENIIKNRELKPGGSQIINIESGNFSKGPRSDIDLAFDLTTNDPGMYAFEKMFSGGYFGGISLAVLKQAAAEGLFTSSGATGIIAVEEISSGDANDFASGKVSEGNILRRVFYDPQDEAACRLIIDTLIDRAAKLVAASMIAVVQKTGKGNSPECPVLVTVEGTTFYKLHRFREYFEAYFNEYLSGDRKRYVLFTEVAGSSLIGAALAALID